MDHPDRDHLRNPLGSNQLNAFASVAGTNTYSPAAGTVLNAGTNMLSVNFTPTDGVDYSNAAETVTLMVFQAPLKVTASNASRAYGQINPVSREQSRALSMATKLRQRTIVPGNGERTLPDTYPIVPSLVDPVAEWAIIRSP